MPTFISRLWKKDLPPEPGTIVREHWSAPLGKPARARFLETGEERYSGAFVRGSFRLTLLRNNLFAWSDCPPYSYSDFVTKARMSFDGGKRGAGRKTADAARRAGESACGILFRKSGDENFLCALVSDGGMVRVDAVFNQEPRTIVGWTDCPWLAGKDEVELTVISRGPHVTILADGIWACEAEDDSFEAGSLAFCGQTWDPSATASFLLRSFSVESRPVEVEVWHYRHVDSADPSQRVRLAETYFAQGAFMAALLELDKAGRNGKPSPGASFLAAECAIRLERYDEAEASLRACLALAPGHADAREELYNLLYLRGHYLELRDSLLALSSGTLPESADTELPDQIAASPRLANLLGHAQYNLGSWKDAARAYEAAHDAAVEAGDDSAPLFGLNAARSLEKAGDARGAVGLYAEAAGEFLAQEAWDDAEACADRLKALRFESIALDTLEGKILFGRGDLARASKLLSKVVRKGSDDAHAHYLLGLCLAREGKRREAGERFREASELVPEEGLYTFRLAESLFLEGRPCGPELERALSSAPEGGWILNLASMDAASRGDWESAAAFAANAVERLGDAPEAAINLSNALARLGKREAAICALEPHALSPAAHNQKGNIFAEAGDLESAAASYERAIALAPPGPARETDEYRMNLAACRIEQGRFADADGQLRKALETGNDPRALRLVARVATELGDWVRAEAAFRTALDLEPSNSLAMEGLCDNYLSRGLRGKARALFDRLSALDPPRASRLERLFSPVPEIALSCALCGRAWRVPQPVPPVARGALRGEPPDESPAGKCPSCGRVYCVACRKGALSNKRFTCSECGSPLKIADDGIRWLVREAVRNGASPE